MKNLILFFLFCIFQSISVCVDVNADFLILFSLISVRSKNVAVPIYSSAESEEITQFAFFDFIIIEYGIHTHLENLDSLFGIGVKSVFLTDGL